MDGCIYAQRNNKSRAMDAALDLLTNFLATCQSLRIHYKACLTIL